MSKKLFSIIFLLSYASLYSQTTLTLLNSYSVEDDVPEPSGLAYDKINNQLFTVSDTKDIFRLSITGELLESYDFEGDLEGISMFNSPNTLLVAIEDEYELVEYNYVTGATTTHEMDYESRNDPAGGIEGVSYNPTTGDVYFVNEKDPNALIIANSDFDVTNEYELDFSGDLSALYYVEETNNLWMGSDNSSSVYKCDLEGNVLQSFELTQDDDEDSDLLAKLEGIAIDHTNQLLYVITDEGKMLYVYQMTTETVTDCNGDIDGTASIDDCEVCSGGNTGIERNTSCELDCNEDYNGTATIDNCEICSGGNTGLEVDACQECSEPFATHEDGENLATNILDNLNTRWSGFGIGTYNEICLGDTVSIETISIAFFRGDERSNFFDIEVSLDGINWVTVLEDQVSSGETLEQEDFILPNITEAWKLRFIGGGNDNNSEWNSVTKLTWSGVVTGTNKSLESQIAIFPNPVTDQLNIRQLSSGMTWNVLNPQGQLILTGSDTVINTSHLEDGVYLLALSNGKIIKFVK